MRSPLGSIALALLLVGAGAASAESVQRPSLTPGDTWAYSTNSTLPAGFVLQGRFTSTVRAAPAGGNVTVDLAGSGTTTGQLRPPAGDGLVTGTWTLTGEDDLEPAGLKIVYSVLDLSVNGTYQGVVPFRFHLVNTSAFEIVQDGWRFPLSSGGRGNVSMRLNYSQDAYLVTPGSNNATHSNGTANWTAAYAMENATSVATPAGTFVAYPIDQVWPDGSRDRAYFSPSVGNNVRTESYNESGSLVGTTLLLGYRYQALEPATILGLTLTAWAIVGGTVGAAAVVAAWFLRKRRKERGPVPPSMQDTGRT